MEGITENGLGSIRVGLEDYERAVKTGDDARLTSAVRNVFAGIIILAKSKLYELSPDGTDGILARDVRSRLVNGRFELVPNGRKTVSYQELKMRLGHFAVTLDWEKIQRIRDIRNDLEHFYHSGTRSNVQEALADAAVVIPRLLAMLRLDPVRHLGGQWWEILLSNKKVFAAELAACRQTLSAVAWINQTAAAAVEHLSCGQCSSPLMRQIDADNHEQEDVQVRCAACGAESDIQAQMERAVESWHYRDLYQAQTQGGELPVARCPRCLMHALVIGSNECAICGNTLDASAVWCEVCHNPMTAAEHEAGTHQCPVFHRC
jgi:hypothetical protein